MAPKASNKGRRQQQNKRNPQDFVAPADFKVNEKKRNKGTCVYFSRRGGFGFIKPDTAGLVPGDKIMCVWREIQSDDSWPFLHKGLEVEFNVSKFMKANGTGCYLKASNISLPGGKKINLQTEAEDAHEFVHSKATRFSGVVRFYNAARGKGFVVLDEGYAGVDDVPKSLVIVRNEINTDGGVPTLCKDLKVEFGIQKTKDGFYTCYNLTLPGGKPVDRLVVEQRKTQGNALVNGEVAFYDVRKGFGYIKPDSGAKIPANIKNMMVNNQKEVAERLEKKGKDRKASAVEPMIFFRRGDMKEGGRISRGNKASFKLYTDNRGVGAHDVKITA